jgi:hypothetical protein
MVLNHLSAAVQISAAQAADAPAAAGAADLDAHSSWNRKRPRSELNEVVFCR